MQDSHLCYPPTFSLAPQCPPLFYFQNRHWLQTQKHLMTEIGMAPFVWQYIQKHEISI